MFIPSIRLQKLIFSVLVPVSLFGVMSFFSVRADAFDVSFLLIYVRDSANNLILPGGQLPREPGLTLEYTAVLTHEGTYDSFFVMVEACSVFNTTDCQTLPTCGISAPSGQPSPPSPVVLQKSCTVDGTTLVGKNLVVTATAIAGVTEDTEVQDFPGFACLGDGEPTDPQCTDCCSTICEQQSYYYFCVGDEPPPTPPSGGYEGPIIHFDQLLGAILNLLYPVAIGIGVAFIIIAGYQIMTSEGQQDRLREGKEKLTSAIIGMIFVLLSATILRVIISSILGGKGWL